MSKPESYFSQAMLLRLVKQSQFDLKSYMSLIRLVTIVRIDQLSLVGQVSQVNQDREGQLENNLVRLISLDQKEKVSQVSLDRLISLDQIEKVSKVSKCRLPCFD